MSIHTVSKTAVLLITTLLLVACESNHNQASMADRPDKPTAASASAATANGEQQLAVDTATFAPSPSATGEPVATLPPAELLPDLGPAPDIENEIWLNTDRPLDLAALRGKVVLVEFWTFG